MTGTAFFVAAMLSSTIGVAMAQDAIKVAPQAYKVIQENERVRVLELTLKPGEKVPQHAHPAHILYMVTAGNIVFAPPGKTPYELALEPGDVQSFPQLTLATENSGDNELRALVIEMKGSSGEAVMLAKGKGKAKFAKLKARTKVAGKAAVKVAKKGAPKVAARASAKVAVKASAKKSRTAGKVSLAR